MNGNMHVTCDHIHFHNDNFFQFQPSPKKPPQKRKSAGKKTSPKKQKKPPAPPTRTSPRKARPKPTFSARESLESTPLTSGAEIMTPPLESVGATPRTSGTERTGPESVGTSPGTSGLQKGRKKTLPQSGQQARKKLRLSEDHDSDMDTSEEPFTTTTMEKIFKEADKRSRKASAICVNGLFINSGLLEHEPYTVENPPSPGVWTQAMIDGHNMLVAKTEFCVSK